MWVQLFKILIFGNQINFFLFFYWMVYLVFFLRSKFWTISRGVKRAFCKACWSCLRQKDYLFRSDPALTAHTLRFCPLTQLSITRNRYRELWIAQRVKSPPPTPPRSTHSAAFFKLRELKCTKYFFSVPFAHNEKRVCSLQRSFGRGSDFFRLWTSCGVTFLKDSENFSLIGWRSFQSDNPVTRSTWTITKDLNM